MLFQVCAKVSPWKQNSRFWAPVADLSCKAFNWCPVTPISFTVSVFVFVGIGRGSEVVDRVEDAPQTIL